MLSLMPTPLVRLGNIFPRHDVYAKCEFLAPSGSFKIRGATHLLDHLQREGDTRHLIVPSMGNTALGAATGAQAFGFSMTGVVPQTIARAKDEKLRALGVELIKIAGGGSDLLRCATDLAKERGGYFVHPHLDPLWTDGYQSIAAEVVRDLPGCRSLVFPVGGGGLLFGPAGIPTEQPARDSTVRLRAVQLPKVRPLRPLPVDHDRGRADPGDSPPTGAAGDRGQRGGDLSGRGSRHPGGAERPVRCSGGGGRTIERDYRGLRQSPRRGVRTTDLRHPHR
jgi:Pyridoxal-phosphate dependent enzyme